MKFETGISKKHDRIETMALSRPRRIYWLAIQTSRENGRPSGG